MEWATRYIYDQLNIRQAGMVDPGSLGPCTGTGCKTCAHYDELIGGLTKSSETQKPTAANRAKAQELKSHKTRHKKARGTKKASKCTCEDIPATAQEHAQRAIELIRRKSQQGLDVSEPDEHIDHHFSMGAGVKEAGIGEDAENWLGGLRVRQDHLRTPYQEPSSDNHAGNLSHNCLTCPNVHYLQKNNLPIPGELVRKFKNEHCPSCGSYTLNGHRCDNCEDKVPNWEGGSRALSGKFEHFCMGCGLPFEFGREHEDTDQDSADLAHETLEGTERTRGLGLSHDDFFDLIRSPGNVEGGHDGFCYDCVSGYNNRDVRIIERPGYGELQEWHSSTMCDPTERIPELYCRNCGSHIGEGNSCSKCPKEAQCSCKGGTLF